MFMDLRRKGGGAAAQKHLCEKHPSVAFCIHANPRSRMNPQPRRMPCPGFKPTTFLVLYIGQHSNQLNQPARAKAFFEKLPGLAATTPSCNCYHNQGEQRITHWFPNSDATKRKPVLSTHIAAATGTVSKYLSRISVTWNEKK